MGVDRIVSSVVGGVVGGVGGILGVSQTRRANKRAENQAREQERYINEDRARTRAEQDKLSQRVEQQQKKIAAGQARANRSRLRGGVFGESEPTLRNLNTTLG